MPACICHKLGHAKCSQIAWVRPYRRHGHALRSGACAKIPDRDRRCVMHML